MDPTSDKALMLKVKQGNLQMLGLLFERHKRPLFGFFYRLTNDSAISEDLVQGVFERILKHRNTYEGEGSFKSWIYGIARNLHIDHYRKEKRSLIDTKEELQHFPEEADPVSDDEYRKVVLDKALQSLPDEKREILIMSRYQGLTYKEIGEITGLSEGAVKLKAFRTVNELRNIVQQLSQTN